MADDAGRAARARRGLAFAGLGVFLFSATLPFTKLALRGFTPAMIGLGRAAIAGVVAAAVLRIAGRRRPPEGTVPALLRTAVGIVVGFPLLMTTALQFTTAGHAAVVIAALPIATAVLGVVRGDERPSVWFWIAAATGGLAVALVAITRGGADGADPLADLLLLGAVGAAAFGYTEGALLTRRMPGWQVVSWALVLSLPLTLAVTAFELPRSLRTLGPDGAATLGLLYVALVSMYAGFFAWYRGLADAGIARASQVQVLQPILTLGWSLLLLPEPIAASTVAAALLVVAAAIWAQRTRVTTIAPPEG
ncbi:MAG: DMT family transporter [Actinomycetota bacterium]